MKKLIKDIQDKMSASLVSDVSPIDKEYNKKYKSVWDSLVKDAVNKKYDSDSTYKEIPAAMKARDEAIEKRKKEQEDPSATSPIQNARIDFYNQFITILEEHLSR